MLDKFGYILAALWLLLLVVLFKLPTPPDDPSGAPVSGVGLCRGYPVHYTSPAPLSYNLREVPNDTPLSYTERFSPNCVGPQPDYSALGAGSISRDELLRAGACPVARAAVAEQGVGH